MPRDYQDPYAEIPVKDFSYTNSSTPPKAPKASKRPWIIAGIVILVIAVVAGSTLVLIHHKSQTPKKTTSSSAATQTNAFGLAFNPSTAYSSTNLNLDVNYPKGWMVNETSSTLTILSPVTKLTTENNQVVDGKILVSVFNQGDIPSAFGNGTSVAVINSVLLSYQNPTQDQDAQTYITFVQYPVTTAKGGLDAIYVTGNYGYDYGQNIPNSDIGSVDPLVVFSFLKCVSFTCATTTNLTLASTEWNNQSFASLIDSIVKSFVFY